MIFIRKSGYILSADPKENQPLWMVFFLANFKYVLCYIAFVPNQRSSYILHKTIASVIIDML